MVTDKLYHRVIASSPSPMMEDYHKAILGKMHVTVIRMVFNLRIPFSYLNVIIVYQEYTQTHLGCGVFNSQLLVIKISFNKFLSKVTEINT